MRTFSVPTALTPGVPRPTTRPSQQVEHPHVPPRSGSASENQSAFNLIYNLYINILIYIYIIYNLYKNLLNSYIKIKLHVCRVIFRHLCYLRKQLPVCTWQLRMPNECLVSAQISRSRRVTTSAPRFSSVASQTWHG